MTEFAAAPPCRKTLFSGGALHFNRNPQKQSLQLQWQCNLQSLKVAKRPILMAPKLKVAQTQMMMTSPSTYTTRISTDIPLYETPGASFDEYLENKPRVFKAIFPDKRRSQQLNDEEWRVHMLPIEFLFLTVLPVIDMRLACKSSGTGYPPGVPKDTSKVLELNIVRWELQGLDEMLKPSHFNLGVKGSLYPYRRGPRTRLKGQLQMSISFDLPPMLALVPENVRREVADSVLKRLVENMRDKVNTSLISDYGEFKKERPKALASAQDLT